MVFSAYFNYVGAFLLVAPAAATMEACFWVERYRGKIASIQDGSTGVLNSYGQDIDAEGSGLSRASIVTGNCLYTGDVRCGDGSTCVSFFQADNTNLYLSAKSPDVSRIQNTSSVQ